MIEGLPAVQHVHFDRKFNRARRPRFSGVNVPVKLSRRTWRKRPTTATLQPPRAPALESSLCLDPFALGPLQHRRYPYTSSAIPIRPRHSLLLPADQCVFERARRPSAHTKWTNRYIAARSAHCATGKWISITSWRSIAFLFSFTGIKRQPDYGGAGARWMERQSDSAGRKKGRYRETRVWERGYENRAKGRENRIISAFLPARKPNAQS